MKHRKSKKKAIIYISILVAVAALGSAYWIIHDRNASNEPFATSSSPADNDLNNSRKISSTPAKTLDSGPTVTPNTAPVTSNSNATLTITRAGVVNSNLQVGTLVSNGTSGTCVLSVSQSGQQTITQTEQVSLQNSSYTCPVFNIPLTQFPNQGKWNVSIDFNNGSTTATSEWANNPVDLSEAL